MLQSQGNVSEGARLVYGRCMQLPFLLPFPEEVQVAHVLWWLNRCNDYLGSKRGCSLTPDFTGNLLKHWVQLATSTSVCTKRDKQALSCWTQRSLGTPFFPSGAILGTVWSCNPQTAWKRDFRARLRSCTRQVHYRRWLNSTELCCGVAWPGAAASPSEGINPGLALALHPLVPLPLNLIVTHKSRICFMLADTLLSFRNGSTSKANR